MKKCSVCHHYRQQQHQSPAHSRLGSNHQLSIYLSPSSSSSVLFLFFLFYFFSSSSVQKNRLCNVMQIFLIGEAVSCSLFITCLQTTIFPFSSSSSSSSVQKNRLRNVMQIFLIGEAVSFSLFITWLQATICKCLVVLSFWETSPLHSFSCLNSLKGNF